MLMVATLPARAGNAEEASAAAADLFRSMSARDLVAVSRYIPPQGFSEFGPTSPALHQLNVNAFEGLFASGMAIDLRATDIQVQTLGDTAIVTGTRVGAITAAGATPVEGRNAFTMVWAKRGAQWQLQHIHLSGSQP
jgi:ketosteroid isomerase-like protein